MVDVTIIASSSTSTTSTPEVSKTKWVVRPKVVTQEPTVGKTDSSQQEASTYGSKDRTTRTYPARGVEPQEPVLPQGGAKNEEADILQETKSMLKDFAQSVLATTSQVQIPQAVMMSAKRYATWVFNTLP